MYRYIYIYVMMCISTRLRYTNNHILAAGSSSKSSLPSPLRSKAWNFFFTACGFRDV